MKGMKVAKRKKMSFSKTSGAAKSSWFMRGYEPAREVIKKTEEARSRGFTKDFWLKEDETATIRFMSTEPFNIYEHRVTVNKRFTARTCSAGSDGSGKCLYCESGNKRRFVGIYPVIDRRKQEWKGKDGKKKSSENDLKFWHAGQRIIATLDRVVAKRGTLTKMDVEVTRVGEGPNTTYNIQVEPPSPLTGKDKKVIKEMPDLEEAFAPKSLQEQRSEVNIEEEEEEDEDVDIDEDEDDDDEE